MMSGTIFFICSTSAISALCCAQNFSLTVALKHGEEDARTKRRRQDCGKIKADGDEPDIHCLDKFLIRELEPIASQSQGILEPSTWKPDARARRNSKPDATSSSQGKLKYAYLGDLMVCLSARNQFERFRVFLN